MKCPTCGKNHPKKLGLQCSCGYTFVFNPGTDPGMTDGKFVAIVRRASAGGDKFFTLLFK